MMKKRVVALALIAAWLLSSAALAADATPPDWLNTRPEDEAAVLALYRSLLGTPGTTWNEYYPGPEEVTADTARGSLWCAWGEDGSLLAAASLGDDDPDIRDLSCWTPAAKSCELSRVGVRRDLHGQGMGEAFTRRLLEEAVTQWDAETAATLAVRALLHEVCTTPKPGLVDRANSGRGIQRDLFKPV